MTYLWTLHMHIADKTKLVAWNVSIFNILNYCPLWTVLLSGYKMLKIAKARRLEIEVYY